MSKAATKPAGAVTGGLQDQMLSAARGAAAGVKTAANGLLTGVGIDSGAGSAVEPGLQTKQVGTFDGSGVCLVCCFSSCEARICQSCAPA